MKKLIIILTTFCLTMTLCFNCFAQPNKNENAFDNLSYDLSICAAFYAIMAATTDQPELRKHYLFIAKNSIIAASDLIQYTNLNPEIAATRYKAALIIMLAELSDAAGNTTALYNDYGKLCIAIIDNPEKRLRYWLNK